MSETNQPTSADSKTIAQNTEKVHWSKLEEVDNEDRPPFLLTKTELKLLGIAGVGTFQF